MSNAVEASFKRKIAALVIGLAELPQAECPLKHYFLPGVYLREIFMPAGAIVIGKIHKTKHFNIIQRGCVRIIDERGERILGPGTFVSEGGVQKVLHIMEDTVWTTVHLTNETSLEALETELIEPDPSYAIRDRREEREAIERAAQGRLK